VRDTGPVADICLTSAWTWERVQAARHPHKLDIRSKVIVATVFPKMLHENLVVVALRPKLSSPGNLEMACRKRTFLTVDARAIFGNAADHRKFGVQKAAAKYAR